MRNYLIISLGFFLILLSACNNTSTNSDVSGSSSDLRDIDGEDANPQIRGQSDDDDSHLKATDDDELDSEDDQTEDTPRSDRRKPREEQRQTEIATDTDPLSTDSKISLSPATALATSTVTRTATSTLTRTATSTSTSTITNNQKCIEAPSEWICQVEFEVALEVNNERKKAGVSELRLDPKLAWLARTWSTEQAKRRVISHEWFENGELKKTFVKKFSEDPRLSAENVAMIPCEMDAKATAMTMMRSWMNSKGHRENILRSTSTRIGVGISKSVGGCYGTQDFGF